MLYNVYSSIDDEKFKALSKELEKIENAIQPLLTQNGYTISNEKKDGLVINASKTYENCYSNLAITFDDLPDRSDSFSLGFVKSIDDNSRRFYRKDFVVTSVPLDFIRDNSFSLIEETIGKLSIISIENLLSSDFIDLTS